MLNRFKKITVYKNGKEKMVFHDCTVSVEKNSSTIYLMEQATKLVIRGTSKVSPIKCEIDWSKNYLVLEIFSE